MKMYDGYHKYGADEAASYEEERKKEALWWLEEEFISEYFSKHQPKTMLDAPVGTGRFLPYYRGIQEVVGIDISEKMLAESAQKLKDAELANIKLIRGDIFKLDFPDDHFDLTISWRFAHLVPLPLLGNALQELARVTGGEILLQTYTGPPYRLRLFKSLMRLPGKLIRRLIPPPTSSLAWSHIQAYFHTDKQIANKISEAGLTIQQKIKIGDYNESIVHVYLLKKAPPSTLTR